MAAPHWNKVPQRLPHEPGSLSHVGNVTTVQSRWDTNAPTAGWAQTSVRRCSSEIALKQGASRRALKKVGDQDGHGNSQARAGMREALGRPRGTCLAGEVAPCDLSALRRLAQKLLPQGAALWDHSPARGRGLSQDTTAATRALMNDRHRNAAPRSPAKLRSTSKGNQKASSVPFIFTKGKDSCSVEMRDGTKGLKVTQIIPDLIGREARQIWPTCYNNRNPHTLGAWVGFFSNVSNTWNNNV